MTSPFDVPPGDVGALQTAVTGLASIASTLGSELSTAKAAVAEAKAEWKGPRSDDFEHAGQALVDELAMMITATGNAATILNNYAIELQSTIADVATYHANYDGVGAGDGSAADVDPREASRSRLAWQRLAIDAKSDLHAYALKVAAALDAETGLAAPTSSKLSPAEIGRKVDSSLGFTGFDESNFITGKVSDDAAWAMLGLASGEVYDSGVPVPGDSGFHAWYASLTPTQQLLETQKLQQSFDPEGFDPYATIQGGPLPTWAVTFNDEHQNACYADGRLGDGYGYFGGGTIRGPGGKQWPIVMPYYSDGKYTYMDDYGQGRADGGINELDGHDPGWHTVSTFEGGGQFGSISSTTKWATGLLIATGQDLEVQQVDPDALRVDANGVPFAGKDIAEFPTGPPDKAWWDVTSDTMMPKPLENLPAGSIQPNLKYNEVALGANALIVQGAQALTAGHELDEHARRQWYVDYQVNDDGRVRAVVRTYTAGKLEDGKTGVVGLANAFPTGQSGNTNEVPYKSRFNPYSQTVATAMPDPDVVYSNRSSDVPPNLGPGGYLTEKLNK